MNKLSKTLRNERGNMSILAAVLVIAFFMLYMVTMEVIRINMICQSVEVAMKSAVSSVVVDNYDDAYAAMREGRISGQVREDENVEWEESLDTGGIYPRMQELLGLEKINNDKYIKKFANGQTEATISNLELNIINASRTGDKGETLTVEATAMVEIPFRIGMFEDIPPIKTTLGAFCKYQAKM